VRKVNGSVSFFGSMIYNDTLKGFEVLVHEIDIANSGKRDFTNIMIVNKKHSPTFYADVYKHIKLHVKPIVEDLDKELD
jgi:hypothetical protein